ncbi:MAG: branched-chain amino acid aminotransferase [Alphaproteobacteria bacterium]|nr:branched-chain amino acid aminotransferase [Alphaproteobacteria bacterium]
MEPQTWLDGVWHAGNPPIFGPMTHGAWMASVAFDGARAFEGVMPDLDRHAARAIDSARKLGLEPKIPAEEIAALAVEGVRRFPEGTELYIRPLFWAEDGFVEPDAESTRFMLTLFEMALPAPDATVTAALADERRPRPAMAPTDAKASCLYPNVQRMLRKARQRGFSTALVLDPDDKVAEFATANLFMVRDGKVATPADNGTFLNGITRQRMIGLLQEDGHEVAERTIELEELLEADEVFATGNAPKVIPASRIEDRDFQPGPVARRARELYWAFAHAHGKPEDFGL